MSLLPMSTVRCVSCARRSGRIVNSVFVPEHNSARPTAARTGSRCGHCGGGLYLEPEEAPTAAQAELVAAIRRTTTERAKH